MGVGDPLEATFQLAGPVGAGSWHLVGDGVVLKSVDMQFDVLWRSDGNADQAVVSFSHHFDPAVPLGDAVPFDGYTDGPAVAAHAGDLLVLRMTASSTDTGPLFVPNADGFHTHGRIPSLTLP